MNKITVLAMIGPCLLVFASSAFADFVGPVTAKAAISPDGSAIVRISYEKLSQKEIEEARGRSKHGGVFTRKEIATIYSYNPATDSYAKKARIETGHLAPQFLYISNEGDVVFVSLGEKGALHLFSKDGKVRKSWDLLDFLTRREIFACAKTGSTLQWFKNGAFVGRTFYFRGPSRGIQALRPPYTLMRTANENVEFSGSIDAEKADINMD